MANVNQVFLWGANNSLPATKTNGQAYFATIGDEAYGDSVPTKEAYIYFDKDNERYNVIAKRAIFDAAGNRIDTKYVTVDTEQEITGQKTFTQAININGGINWPHPQNITCSATGNNQEFSIDLLGTDSSGNHYSGTMFQIWSAKANSTILACYNDGHVLMPHGNVTIGGCNLQYDSAAECLNFNFI